MIRVSSTRSLGGTGVVRALFLSAALAIGFAAGQVAPDVASFLRQPAGARVAPVQAPSLVPADDYALRHRFIAPVTLQHDDGTL